MQGTPVNIIVGSHVWVEDLDEAWIDGQVSKINGQEVEIQASDGKTVKNITNWTLVLYLALDPFVATVFYGCSFNL